MPLAGKGMLTSNGVDPLGRSRIIVVATASILRSASPSTGFVEARRYVAHEGDRNISASTPPRLLRCSTSGPTAPRWRNQTEWSRRTIARFKNMIRAVARITISRGQGRARRWHRPPSPRGRRRGQIARSTSGESRSGNVRGSSPCILIESDPRFQTAYGHPFHFQPGAGGLVCPDRRKRIVNAIGTAIADRSRMFPHRSPPRRSLPASTILMWDLAKTDIPAA